MNPYQFYRQFKPFHLDGYSRVQENQSLIKDIQKELPKVISNASFEAANIVLYTDDMDFFKENNGKIKELVGKFKKRIE